MIVSHGTLSLICGPNTYEEFGLVEYIFLHLNFICIQQDNFMT